MHIGFGCYVVLYLSVGELACEDKCRSLLGLKKGLWQNMPQPLTIVLRKNFSDDASCRTCRRTCRHLCAWACVHARARLEVPMSVYL